MSKTSRQRKAAQRLRVGLGQSKGNGQQAEPIQEAKAPEEVLTVEQWEEKGRLAEAKARTRLAEATWDFWDNIIHPDDAFLDDDGERWEPLGGTAGREGGAAALLNSEDMLSRIRQECRNLALSNEYAINGHENRISYIVGSGHSYTVQAKPRQEVSDDVLGEVQAIIDEFIEESGWHKRQQEMRRRQDRDGEVFLRFFEPGIDGEIAMRFVEPADVKTPPNMSDNPAASFGILTDPEDVETVLAYYINGKPVPAEEIQHRKANVDANVKRGLPLFYPVRKNLRRAEKLQRNMSVTSEIQSAIAMLRKHGSGTASTIAAAVHARADHSVRNESTGKTTDFKQYGPGSILDTSDTTEYEFPAHGLDASRFVLVLQSELRAIASRLVMPEFMLTSDASNANYASTMVAEGPAVKYFERLQWDTIVDDRKLFDRVLDAAVEAGTLAGNVRDKIEVHAEPPRVQTRDVLVEAQASEIYNRMGSKSARTTTEEIGLDPDDEKERLAEENEEKKEQWDAMAGLQDGDFKQGQQQPKGDEDERGST